MKELKTKKSAEGARVKEKSDALPRAAKRMLRAGLMERQASRQRDTQEKAPERAAEEQVERAALRGGEMAADAGRAVFRQAVHLRKNAQGTDARTAHASDERQKTEKISRNREILNRAQEVASRRPDTIRLKSIRKKRTVRDGAHRSSAFLKSGHEIAEASKGASQKQAARQFARQTVQATVQAARSAGRLLAQAGQTAARMASAVLSWLGAALAAASPVLVLVLIVGMVGVFLASPFGVFFSNETTQDGMLMRQATAELNEEYYARIGQIEQANPHDILEIEASDGVSAIRWEDVLSVYAVKVTTDGVNGIDVVTMDEQKKEILRGVMWDMNQITYRSVTVKKEVEVVTEDEDGNEVVEMQEIEETTLTIYLHHTTPEQMAAAYGFTEQQNEHLALLRHEEYSVMWASLLGGFTHGGGMIGSDADWVGTGIFAWPLPQSFTITSQFGYRTDPFTGEISYHSGTDIAAPYGTPVLAAAGGTVTVANATDPWGGSYGYYVKIQHDGTFDTLYAHCSSICVTPGQQVRQGEVIGYVGSTGNSTGNHLHFEVWEDGQRQNAMDLFKL
ncbi:peptidoglycan DD-metalloendopeptidase family protein [Ruthenibacterium lactatiformans]|uniref:peptidoglycan DD-metalloendopeptidase family protein n=2 Tax=Ruthenibacterium lactatiformans TaxID=1550024 RepID=UPI0026DAB2D9|nr:peptidoglycan DD-metalloendopeptidase family protein [Ruthenibacterium lactatiformans]